MFLPEEEHRGNGRFGLLSEHFAQFQMPDLEKLAVSCHPLLVEYCREKATVTNFEKGYISFLPANQVFPGEVSTATGILGLHLLAEFSVGETVLVAIPDSGRYWASNINSLSALWGIKSRLVSSRSDGRIPGAWKNPVLVKPHTSFTTGETEKPFAVHPWIRNCKSVVVVDDYCASGDMAIVFVEALREAGIRTDGFITLVEKKFQGGIEAVHKATGTPCAAVLSVEEIAPRGITRLREGVHIIGGNGKHPEPLVNSENLLGSSMATL